MFWLKIAAGLVVAIICLAWYPFWELCAILVVGLALYGWQQESARRHEETQTHLVAIRTHLASPPALTPDPVVALDAFRQDQEESERRLQYALALERAEIQVEHERLQAANQALARAEWRRYEQERSYAITVAMSERTVRAAELSLCALDAEQHALAHQHLLDTLARHAEEAWRETCTLADWEARYGPIVASAPPAAPPGPQPAQ